MGSTLLNLQNCPKSMPLRSSAGIADASSTAARICDADVVLVHEGGEHAALLLALLELALALHLVAGVLLRFDLLVRHAVLAEVRTPGVRVRQQVVELRVAHLVSVDRIELFSCVMVIGSTRRIEWHEKELKKDQRKKSRSPLFSFFFFSK